MAGPATAFPRPRSTPPRASSPQALKPRGISVNAASPGWVRTDMGTENAPLTVEQGAQNIIRLVTDVPHTLTNQFLEENGEIPW